MALSLRFAMLKASFLSKCKVWSAAAALTALAFGGVISSGALALSPTVDTALLYKGGVNIVKDASASTTVLAYTVPTGRRFVITDLVIANTSADTPAFSQFVWTGSNANCDFAAFRTNALTVPAGGTLHLPFVSGIGFNAGQFVCIRNASQFSTGWTIRGFLFE